MYWEAGTTHPTTEFWERRTDNSSCQAVRGPQVSLSHGESRDAHAGGALLAALSVLSHSLKWVRCLLPLHQGTHLPQQHPNQTPRCSPNPFLEQWLPLRVVQTKGTWQFLPGNPKTPANVHTANSLALKHTRDISSLPAFWDLGPATFAWGDPALGLIQDHWKILFF